MINIARIARTAAAAAALTAVAVAGAPAAQAAPVHAKGFSTVQSCTSVSGKITYGKGLTKTVKTHHSVLTGTVAGCTGLNGAQSGTGTISGALVGKSSYKSVTETGTVTVNWPAGAGLQPLQRRRDAARDQQERRDHHRRHHHLRRLHRSPVLDQPSCRSATRARAARPTH